MQDQDAATHLFKKPWAIIWSRTLYLIGIAGLLVFVVPVDWFPFQLGKVGVFALCLLLSFIFFCIGGGARILKQTSGLTWALLVSVLPFSYVLSAYFSTDRPLALVGVGVETDTIIFSLLCFLTFLFAGVLFRSARSAWLLISVVFFSLVCATLFQIVHIFSGVAAIPFTVFGDRSVNVIGKWNDLGLAAAVLMLLVGARLEFSQMSRFKNIGHILLFIVLSLLLAIINFPLVWGMLLVCLIGFILVKFFQSPPDDQRPLWRRHMPWYSLTGSVVVVIFLFFGVSFNSYLLQFFPVTALEVRPSFSATMHIVDASREGSLIRIFIGTGPNTFGQNWLMYKPVEVNQSQFWNLDFIMGFSVLMTVLSTVGLIGVVSWCIAPLLMLWMVLRAMRAGVLRSQEKKLVIALASSSILLLGGSSLYIPGQNMLLLAFVFYGATFGFLAGRTLEKKDDAHAELSRTKHISGVLLAAVLLILIAGSTFVVNRRFLSESFVTQGRISFNNAQSEAALLRAARAAWFEKTPHTQQLLLDAGVLRLQQIASDTTLPTATAQTKFTALVTPTVPAGKEAIALDPKDYRTHYSLGALYSLLASLKIPGAYENARASYQNAISYNPTTPAIPLALARLEASAGDTKRAQEHITRALTLKPDYTDAILFVVQLDVANKDIPNAIRAAEAAVRTAPGVASIWFELGLLYYTNHEMQNAIAALEKAVSLTPDYANAKYFLGLSYYTQKRSADAIKEFEDLIKTNPDNQEIKLILSNMRFGKPPFEGAQPPVTDHPEDRSVAPIAQ